MYVRKVLLKILLLLKNQRANVTLKCLDVTDTVSVAQVVAQPLTSREFLAANLAFVLGVPMLRFAAATMSMRRVVVQLLTYHPLHYYIYHYSLMIGSAFSEDNLSLCSQPSSMNNEFDLSVSELASLADRRYNYLLG